jgi:hypothetical protein
MRYLNASAPADAAVLATDPLYALAAGRPLARGAGRPYLADPYGGMLYINLGLAQKSWSEIWQMRQAFDPRLPHDLSEATALFHQAPAQAEVQAALAAADFVVVDRNARRQWSAETLRLVEAGTTPALSVADGDVVLRARSR